MICKNCGEQIESEEKYCPNCGAIVPQEIKNDNNVYQNYTPNNSEWNFKYNIPKLVMGIWSLIGAIRIAAISIVEERYGGDAYTGMQQASARTAQVCQIGFATLLVVIGVLLIANSIQRKE